jgi:putative membrane protein insertion efficiency factor
VWFVTKLALGLIRLYQVATRWVPQHCRFYPSCSHYAVGALTRYGLVRGSWLTLVRLLKCHPGHPGGVDEVP